MAMWSDRSSFSWLSCLLRATLVHKWLWPGTMTPPCRSEPCRLCMGLGVGVSFGAGLGQQRPVASLLCAAPLSREWPQTLCWTLEMGEDSALP